jgi:hypothetical protein
VQPSGLVHAKGAVKTFTDTVYAIKNGTWQNPEQQCRAEKVSYFTDDEHGRENRNIFQKQSELVFARSRRSLLSSRRD